MYSTMLRKLAIDRRSAKVVSMLAAGGPGDGRGVAPPGTGAATPAGAPAGDGAAAAGPSGNPPVNVSTARNSRRVLPVKSCVLAVLVRPRNTTAAMSFAAK